MIETIIGVHPGVCRGIGASIFPFYEHARGCFPSMFVEDGKSETAHGSEIFFGFHDQWLLPTTRHLLQPQGCVPAAIGNVGDPLSVRRPAWVDVVEFTIGKRESIAALGRHHPKLVPGLTEIRRIYDALAVRRKIWASFPRSFFVVNFVGLSARFRLHAPEPTRSINMSAIRNK